MGGHMKPTGSWTVSSLIAWNLANNQLIVWSSKTHDDQGSVLSFGMDGRYHLEIVEDGLLVSYPTLSDELIRLKRAIALMER
jgi:hypothetical protein